jgi:hypothetical protein
MIQTIPSQKHSFLYEAERNGSQIFLPSFF